jgi:hypothetical protein
MLDSRKIADPPPVYPIRNCGCWRQTRFMQAEVSEGDRKVPKISPYATLILTTFWVSRFLPDQHSKA